MRTNRFILGPLLMMSIFLGGCAAQKSSTRGFPFSRPSQPSDFSTVSTPATQPAPASAVSPSVQDLKKSDIVKSTPATMQTGLLGGESVPTVVPKTLTDPDRQKLLLNFDKADVIEVTNQLFGEYLKVNYVIDQGVRGQISLFLEGEYTKQELLELITRAYNANNIDIVPQKGLYRIQTMQRSMSSNLPIANRLTLKEDKYGLKPVIIIYRLRYLDANQAVNTVKYFLTPGRSVGADPLTNSIIMVEDTANAQTILGILKTIDMNILKEVGMEIVQLKSIPPLVAVQNLDAMMSKLDLFKNSKLTSNVLTLPLEQLGGVLIMAQNPDFLKTAKEWLLAMDVQGQAAGEQVYVHFIENGLARDIASIIGQLYGLNVQGGTTGPREQIVSATRSGGLGRGTLGGGGLGGGFGSSSMGGGFGSSMGGSSGYGRSGTVVGLSGQSSYGGGGLSGQSAYGQTGQGAYGTGVASQRSLGQSTRGQGGYSTQPTSGGGLAGQVSSGLTGQVSIIPDDVNNAIVIKANAADYAKIKTTIQELDIVPRAVLIEVTLAEVTLNDELEYGIEYFIRNKGMDIAGQQGKYSTIVNNGRGLVKNLLDPTTGVANAAAPGLSFLWSTVTEDFRVLIQLLSQETQVNILSNPTLLAMDNQEATLTVGGREPILSESSTSTINVNAVTNSIEYVETGIILDVIPHINSGGLVRMDVDQTIRTAEPNTVSGIDSPTFSERHVRTSLLAQDGSTAVIGGIIQQSHTINTSGIPFLRDVPIIAPLFSSKSNKSKRTELIVAITPHVVKQTESESSREFLQKLKQLRRRVETQVY
jgi:general secretion pathway protein D